MKLAVLAPAAQAELDGAVDCVRRVDKGTLDGPPVQDQGLEQKLTSVLIELHSYSG